MRKGWQEIELGEICELHYGKGIKQEDYCTDGKVKIFGTGGLIGTTNLPKQYIGPSIIIGRKGSINSPLYVDKDVAFRVIDTAYFLKTDQHTSFIYYLISSINLSKWNEASGVPSLNRDTFYSIKTLLPPLAEQKKIAAILRTWDDAIEKQDKIVASLQKKRKALLGKLLLKQQTNKPLKYFAKPVAREVDKPTSAYHALGLRSHCKGTFQRFIKDAATVAMETLYQVKENDLIVNITFAWEGAIALVKKDDEHCLVSHRFPTYEIDTSKALPQFIRHVVQTKKFIESLGIISPGGAGRNRVLSKKDFLELKIWLPDLSTQAHIADIISTLELEIETATALLEKFKTQKRGLMQKLLTGAWPVQTEIIEETSNQRRKTP